MICRAMLRGLNVFSHQVIQLLLAVRAAGRGAAGQGLVAPADAIDR